MIAIPDFISGAMEHWGLITYREVNMLYDEQEASVSNKQRCTLVIAHEMAHMVRILWNADVEKIKYFLIHVLQISFLILRNHYEYYK